MNKLEALVYWLLGIPRLPLLVFFSIIGLCVGFTLVINPCFAIEMQKRFYAGINWKIEPISMKKEIRNTRIMGSFLIFLLVATLVFCLAKRSVLL